MAESDLITVAKASEEFGWTRDAIYQKIRNRKWIEGQHFHRAPDGRLFIDRAEIQKWIRGF